MYTVDWSQLEPRYAALLGEELRAEHVMAWLNGWSELERSVWEARAWHKRARARDTREPNARAEYQRFVEQVFLPSQAAGARLSAKLLALHDWQPAPEIAQFVQRLRYEASAAPGRASALEAELAALESQASDALAAMSVSYEGRDLSLAEAEALLADPSRARREAVWRATQASWARQGELFDDLFVRLVRGRQTLARQAGFANFRDYSWRAFGRLDYQPADSLQLHEVIAAEVLPLAAERLARRRAQLGLRALRPWDLAVVSNNGAPPRRFADADELADTAERVLDAIDPALGAMFRQMRPAFLDLGPRSGKMAGGEEWVFPVTGLAYIHLNAPLNANGLLILLHECGHAYHDMLSAHQQPLFWNLGGPSEFAEFAAMMMVALALPHFATAGGYGAAEAAQIEAGYLEEIVVRWLPEIAMGDAFQHWVYAEAPVELSATELRARWSELAARFQPGVDWSGLAQERAAGWQQRRLFFSAPFYSIEYVLAHLGALQLRGAIQREPQTVFENYRAALSLGSSRSLPELFAAAGTRLPFAREVVRAAVDSLSDE